MSNSNWSARDSTFYLIVGFVILALCGYFIWGLSALHTEEAAKAGQRASQYANDTEQQILESCLVPELAAMRDCVSQKIKASEENQRAAKDLVAQDVTARWTFGMFWLGLVSSILSLLGIYYLRANLDEMVRARLIYQNEVEASELEQRAWIDVSIIEASLLDQPHPNGFAYSWKLAVENVGKSVAVDVFHDTYIFKSNFWFAHNHAAEHFLKVAKEKYRSDASLVYFPGVKTEMTAEGRYREVEVFDGWSEEELYFCVAKVFMYRTYGSKTIRTAINIFEAKEVTLNGAEKPIFLRICRMHT